MNTLVSIIIATYHRPKELDRAIKSALDQTYRNVEIIVVDDNEYDSDMHIMTQETVKRYKDIVYIKNDKNIGVALSRNNGIDAAKGEYIAFLDDDDEYLSSKIEKQINLIIKYKDDNVGLVYCYSDRYDSHGKLLKHEICDHEGLPIYEHMLGCIAGTPLWLVSKKALIDCDKFSDAPANEDSILLLKLLVKKHKIRRVPESLINIYEHGENGMSGNNRRNVYGISEYREWCRRYYYLLVDKDQVKDVEYSFSDNLLTLCVLNNMHKESFQELRNMLLNKPFTKRNLTALYKYLFAPLYQKRITKNGRKRI